MQEQDTLNNLLVDAVYIHEERERERVQLNTCRSYLTLVIVYLLVDQ